MSVGTSVMLANFHHLAKMLSAGCSTVGNRLWASAYETWGKKCFAGTHKGSRQKEPSALQHCALTSICFSRGCEVGIPPVLCVPQLKKQEIPLPLASTGRGSS